MYACTYNYVQDVHDYFIMQEPLERKLGQRLSLAHQVSRPYLKVVHDCVCEVPLLQSLRQLLKQPLIFEEVGYKLGSRVKACI